MNQAQAITKLRKKLGSHFAYRTNPRALIGDDLAAAHVALGQAVAAKKAALEVLEAKRAEILAAHPEYQALKAAHAEAVKAQEKAGVLAWQRRVTVGTASSMFFSVKAEGDNWEEVVSKVCPTEAA